MNWALLPVSPREKKELVKLDGYKKKVEELDY